MKRKWHHPEESETSHKQWRSLGELEGSEEFTEQLEREFPRGAAELELTDENSRRDFVKLMGASTALAGLGVSCTRPIRHLIPFNEGVEWSIPGKALYYSSVRPSMNGLGGDPLVITTYDGRPTKVDGNKLHPVRSGGSSQFTQASILDLYDPDRSKGYLNKGAKTTKVEFDAFLESFKADAGKKVGFLVDRNSSPARNGLLKKLAVKYSNAKFYTHNALQGTGQDEANAELFGEGVVTVPNLSKAKRILAIDCDFLGNEPIGEDSNWEFSKGRKVDDGAVDKMNRLYAVEPTFSLTGGMADHRYRLAPSQVLSFLLLLAKDIGGAVGGLNASEKVVSGVFNKKWISECAADLVEAKGKSLIVLGDRYSKECHLVAAAINGALGAYSEIISGVKHDVPKLSSIKALAKDAANLDTLFILGESDPVFDAPADVDFGKTISDVETVVHVGPRTNLTAKAATWHVPAAHYLESWGDCVTTSGYYSVQQPVISPLWGGVSEIEFYLSLLSTEEVKADAALDVVKASAKKAGLDWGKTVRIGFGDKPILSKVALTADAGKAKAAISKSKLADLPYAKGVEVVFTVGNNFDGRFANNSWMQEAPDPISKLTWDNAALTSIATAEHFDLSDGDMVSLTKDGKTVEVPILVSPGHADFTFSVHVGYYGDEKLGRSCDGVGFNVYPFVTTESPLYLTGVELSKVGGKKHKLALTAEHYSMEGRAIVREGTKKDFVKKPEFAKTQGMDSHIPANVSFYKGPDYKTDVARKDPLPDDARTLDADDRNALNQAHTLPGREFKIDPNHQWGMTIDLNSCTGCNACVVACQAENNIPVVGKNQVLAGREMHWIRMDRYFTSPNDKEIISERDMDSFSFFKGFEEEPGKRKVDDDNIEMLPQPVACQQCESAPCEVVCPVNATVHTSDGLNAMTYNRCIGTRYCANNCPYKARRFNFYDYNKRPIEDKTILGVTAPGVEFGPLASGGHATTEMQLQKNPNVTVRMRGVIEKCTYCVQRLQTAKIAAKVSARDSANIQVKKNSVTVACQDACPNESIVFGNLKAKGDAVRKSKKSPRSYDLLNYVGTLPRTSYLARIKNPNMKMPGADKVGTVTKKMH